MQSKKPEHLKNQFFDINKLPTQKGLLVFGLSMNKLRNRQNAKNCERDIRIFHTTKIAKPLVGLNFIYSDFLYLYSDESAPKLKESFMHQVIEHKNSMQKIIAKKNTDFQIQHAFNYLVWNQLYVGTNDFNSLFKKIKDIYKKDKKFQFYIKQDCEQYGREMKENQVNYFLEEFLMFYLLTKGKVSLPNDYIEHQEKWVLFCYPGMPLRGHVYLYQLNPFKLEWKENPYQDCFYDLKNKKLIDFTRVDLETYNPY